MNEFIFIVAAVYYLTRIFLYEDKDSHVGPFPSKTRFVYNSDTKHTQPVTLFDWVRRSIPLLNPYKIERMVKTPIWTIDKLRMERWTCPTCLAFWISIPFSLYWLWLSQNLLETIIVHFAISGISSFLNYLADYVQMQNSDTEENRNTEPVSGIVPEL